MKHLATFLAIVVLGQAVAVPLYTMNKPRAVKKSDLDLCPLCIQFAGQSINQLLNIILNAGVVGGCGELCKLLEDKVNSKVVGEACNILCDVVGIKEFISIIRKADLDPIYYCELLTVCPIVDGGDATINSLTVSPLSGPQGTTFVISMTFTTEKGTGTGEIDVVIETVDGTPVGDNELSEPLSPGTYNVTWPLHAKPDPNCDPSQGSCEQWLPGIYNVSTAICNGECGSKHPHSQVYDMAGTTFRITQSLL